MNSEDKARLIKLYEDRFKVYGSTERTLGWNGPEDQRLRFSILADVDDLSGRSVCDVGCGFGDLLPYLEARFGELKYTGIDLAPSLVDEAKRRHPKGRFYCGDILDSAFSEQCDYFLLSGALSFRIADNLAHSHAVLQRMFESCNRGLAANFLTTYVTFEREHNFHHNPDDMFSFAKSMTQWVSIRHDYPLWEFTVFMYKIPPTSATLL